MSNNGKNKQNTVFNLYLEAVSVWNSKRQNNNGFSDGITFNTSDYYLIKVEFIIMFEENTGMFFLENLFRTSFIQITSSFTVSKYIWV